MKSQSVDFAKSAMTDDSLLVFGSSEFSTPKKVVPQVPVGVFGENDYGLRCMLVGEAYDQSLWHAIALGAYAREGVPRDKVVLIISPGGFVDGGIDGETFKTRFSYSLYAGFSANPNVPDEAKRYVRDRLMSLGVDEMQVSASAGSMPQDALNAVVLGAIDDLRIRRGLADVRAGGDRDGGGHVDGGRAADDLDLVRVLRRLRDGLDEGRRLRGLDVHLPVSGDDFSAHVCFFPFLLLCWTFQISGT